MSGFTGPSYLAPTGTTGNNTHASLSVAPAASKLAVVYVAEVAGTTATWKVQGSLDLGQVSDANSNWFDIPYVTAANDTVAAAAIVRTTLGADVIWLSLSHIRFMRKIRAVVTSNTGQTYRIELHQQYMN